MRNFNYYLDNLYEVAKFKELGNSVVEGRVDGRETTIVVFDDGVQPVVRDNRGWFVCTTYANIQEFVDQIESDGATWEEVA